MLSSPASRMILTIAVTAIALALSTPTGLDGAESDLWTTHSAPDPVSAEWPFTVTVVYGNDGPDPATSAYVNSYFTAPMGLDVFIDDVIFGSGVLYDTIQASAEGTDTLGNAPVLYWDDYFCEELLFQLMMEIKKLRDEGITAAEETRIKNQIKGNLVLSLESSNSHMSRIARQEIYFGKYLSVDDVIRGVDRVTADDIARLSRDLFARENLALSILGPLNRSDLPDGLLDI